MCSLDHPEMPELVIPGSPSFAHAVPSTWSSISNLPSLRLSVKQPSLIPSHLPARCSHHSPWLMPLTEPITHIWPLVIQRQNCCLVDCWFIVGRDHILFSSISPGAHMGPAQAWPSADCGTHFTRKSMNK